MAVVKHPAFPDLPETSPRTPSVPGRLLVRRSIDLHRLYRHAAAECEPGLRLVLDENMRTLATLIAELERQWCLGHGAVPRRRGSWHAAVHRHMTGWLMRPSPGREQAWIRVLARREGLLLASFERAIEQWPAEPAQVLRRQLPRLRGIHLDMHHLVGDIHC